MFSISNLVTGLVMIVLGVLMVKYSFQVANFTGRQEWIERYVGGGSTYGVYKLFGVFLVVLGILFATGFGADTVKFIFSPFENVFRPLVQQK